MTYQVLFTSDANKMIDAISDRRVREQIVRRARQLAEEPEKQGRLLRNELAGYRSVRAAGQRYRIIYQIIEDQVRVVVIAAGIRRESDRRDAYTLAQRIVRLGLVDTPE